MTVSYFTTRPLPGTSYTTSVDVTPGYGRTPSAPGCGVTRG